MTSLTISKLPPLGFRKPRNDYVSQLVENHIEVSHLNSISSTEYQCFGDGLVQRIQLNFLLIHVRIIYVLRLALEEPRPELHVLLIDWRRYLVLGRVHIVNKLK